MVSARSTVRPSTGARARWVWLALIGLSAMLGTACGDDESADAAAPLCEAGDDLSAAVADLREVDVAADGTDAFRAAVDEVAGALEDVASAARAELDGAVDAVEESLDGLESAIASFDQQDSASAGVSSVSRAVTDVAETAGALADELEQDCV